MFGREANIETIETWTFARSFMPFKHEDTFYMYDVRVGLIYDHKKLHTITVNVKPYH